MNTNEHITRSLQYEKQQWHINELHSRPTKGSTQGWRLTHFFLISSMSEYDVCIHITKPHYWCGGCAGPFVPPAWYILNGTSPNNTGERARQGEEGQGRESLRMVCLGLILTPRMIFSRTRVLWKKCWRNGRWLYGIVSVNGLSLCVFFQLYVFFLYDVSLTQFLYDYTSFIFCYLSY